MTTLLNQLSPLPGTCTVSLSANTGTPGDVLSTITIDGEVMTVVMGIGSENFIVDRGADPAVHVVGASVTYTAGAPFGSASLADYHAAAGISMFGADGDEAGSVQFSGGTSTTGNLGANINANGGSDGDNIGGGAIVLGGSAGSGTGGTGGDVVIGAGLGDGAGDDGNVLMASLPTSDPGVAGALYTSTGTVKVSAG